MMKKFILILLCIALTVGLFTGCGRKAVEPGETPTGTAKTEGTTNQTESTGQTDATQGTEVTETTDATQGTEPSQEQKPSKEPEPEEDLEPLDIPIYKESVLFEKYSVFKLGEDASLDYGFNSNKDCDQEYILGKLPTTAYRYITPDHAYAIYETDTGCRAYMFFDYVRIANNPVRKGYPILIKEMLSYSDFAGLKVGDSIDVVEQVDGVTSYYKESYKTLNIIAVENLKKWGVPICTIHYLKDGLLRINYTMPEEGKLVISEIIYNEDYCLTDGLNRSVSHKIKSIDLPTA